MLDPLNPADALLADSTARLVAATALPAPAQPAAPATPPADLLAHFEQAADAYGVPADALMALADKDSSFSPTARSRGPGAKTRGIINSTDADMASGVNPYDAPQAIDATARKLRQAMDRGATLDDAIRAHGGGDDYLNDVRGRAQRIADQLYPSQPAAAPPAPEAPAPQAEPAGFWRRYFGDTLAHFGSSVVSGTGDVAAGMAQAGAAYDRNVSGFWDRVTDKALARIAHAFGDEEAARSFEKNAGALSQVGGAVGKVALEVAGHAAKDAGAKIDEKLLSVEGRKALEGLAPTGKLGDISTWSLGKEPSVQGFLLHGVGMFGAMAPIMVGGAIAGPIGAAGAGSVQMSGMGAEQAQTEVERAFKTPAAPGQGPGANLLEQQSKFFRDQLAAGKSPEQALQATKDEAAKFGAGVGAIVGSVGGAAASRLMHPAQRWLAGSGSARAAAAQLGLGAVEGGAVMAGQNAGVTAATNASVGLKNDPTENLVGDFAAGTLAGLVPGGVGVARREIGRRLADRQSAAPPAAPDVVRAPEAAQPAPSADLSGPIGKALTTGAPHLTEAAQPAGRPVTIMDEAGAHTGHIVGHDADGVMFRSSEGQAFLYSGDDIAKGRVKIDARQPEPVARADAPISTMPAEAPRAEPAPHVGADRALVAPDAAPDATHPPVARLEADTRTMPTDAITRDASAPRSEALEAARPEMVREAAPTEDAAQRAPEAARDTIAAPGEEAARATAAEQARRAPAEATSTDRAVARPDDASAKDTSSARPDAARAAGDDYARQQVNSIKERAASTEDPAAGKWFGSRDLAERFVGRKKLADTHDVEQTGRVRFEVVRKDDAPARARAQKDRARRAALDRAAESANRYSIGDEVTIHYPESEARGEILAQTGDGLRIKTDTGEHYVSHADLASGEVRISGEPSPRRSTRADAPVEGMTADTLADHLSSGRDGDIISRLIDAEHVRLHDTEESLPAGARLKGQAVQGVTAPDGKIHLVAKNLTPETARAALLHEAFHAGAEPLVGGKAWSGLMERVRAGVDSVSRGDAEAKAFWREALDRARDAGTPERHLPEEVAAYMVEHAERAPAGLREIANRLIGHVKAWALRKLGRQLGAVTPEQLRSLALTALRSWRDAPGVREVDGHRYSVAERPSAAARDERQPALRGQRSRYQEAIAHASDAVTALMAGARETRDDVGRISTLGLVPVRPLFLELARQTPSARHYIDAKQAMDQLRHRLNQDDSKVLDRWSKWVRKTEIGKSGLRPVNKDANKRLMDLMHESTLRQVDPSELFKPTFTPDDAAMLKRAPRESEAWQKAWAKKEADAQRKADHERLKEKWNRLPEEAQDIYREVRDAYTKRAAETEKEVVANMRRALDAISERAQQRHADELERIAEEGLTGKEKDEAIKTADKALAMALARTARNKAARLKSLRQQFESNRLDGPYFPLSRFGQYFVTVRDADGKVLSFSRFEKRGEQRRFAEEQRALGNKVEEGLASAKGELERNIDPKFVADVDDILVEAKSPDTVRDAVWQRYLESLPDLSSRKNRIHRKGREGFNPDALRAFAHNMFHSGHQLSRLCFGQELQGHIDAARREVRFADDPVRAQAVVNEMVRAHDFVLNPKGAAWSHKATSAAFLWTMGWNLSTGLVVLHDPIQRGISNIGYDAETGNVGVKKSAAAIARTFSEVFRGKGFIENSGRLSPTEMDAMQRAKDLGVIEATNAHDLAGVADAGIDYSPWRHKLMQSASLPLHHAERVNREVTFLAAYRVARDAGLSHEAAIKKAADLTWMSQFDTQASSKARFMRGPAGRAAFALRNFHANIIYRMVKDAHGWATEANPAERKAAQGRFLSSIAITGMMAGLRGAYMASYLIPALATAAGMLGLYDKDKDEPHEWLRRTILKNMPDTMMGRAVGGMLMDGVPGYLTGVNLSERIGVADIGVRSPDREMNAEKLWEYWIAQAGGPALDVGKNLVTGAADVAHGEVQRGAEKMLPAAFRNVSKAIRFAREGVTDKAGDDIVDKVAPQDIAKQFIGLNPAEIADRRARNNFQRNVQTKIAEKRRETLHAMTHAIESHNPDKMEAAREELRRFNAKFPEKAITGRSILDSVKASSRRSSKKEFGVLLDPKLARGIKANTSPSLYAREEND